MSKTGKIILAIAVSTFLIGAAGLIWLTQADKSPNGRANATEMSHCKVNKMVDSQLILCMSGVANLELAESKDPSLAIGRIQGQVNKMDRIAQPACHAAMHLSGGSYAKKHKVTLVNLISYLPALSSTNCAAGFTHGMLSVMGVTPDNAEITLRNVCSKQDERAQQFACVHGIGHGLRHTLGDPKKALAFCATLKGYWGSDCAQGVYHDFFMALPGTPNPTKPLGNKVTLSQLSIEGDVRKTKITRSRSNKVDQFCLTQPRRFRVECWARLTQGPGVPILVRQVADMQYGCGGLPRDHYISCIAGMSVSRVNSSSSVRVCGNLAKSTKMESRACLSRLDLKAVGSAPAGSRDKAPVSPIKYRTRLVPRLLKGCARYMPDRSLRQYCFKSIARFSLRLVPGKATLKQVQGICLAANQEGKPLCRKEIQKAWRESSRLSS